MSSTDALTLIEVLLVIVALVLLMGLLLPTLARPTRTNHRITCVQNLKQMGLAFKLWAGDHGEKYPMQVSVTNGGTMEWVARGAAWPHFQVLSNELNTPKVILCPADKPRAGELEKVMASAADQRDWLMFSRNCPLSYFVGVDAEEAKPSLLLAGDDNLEIGGKPVARGLLSLWANSAVGWTRERHIRCGNVALGDGSTQQFSNAKLREQLANAGVATNRLAIP